ncbi:PREDICTED: protein REVERSION-TO-ETHYLENE SENSITIVITY1 isoform X1 [Camelina sativa]|uniref:Protein REVERSION-TO-ETHYLENE SENSITIVITY1 isoform X1 n=2 Tax=Camelina sativa TaxID=90675 RepID=A0ABM0SX35_CAMSA|nr:PREDICTED: protein REVERSION-TO-ETHYLENE SENSITIVITY1 isoform X1 [Camelina sativa]XP_019083513.1 PREDICTED: protein REVERSION-TO-ETHYLENE SENSITIVITY1 isoform X1 [Camelina sativa]
MASYKVISRGRVPIMMMDLKRSYDVEKMVLPSLMEDDGDDHDLWPLNEIDTRKSKFPCCIVWTPLPVVSWLTPFIGHIGLCREDGVILDFAGSNFINVDDFAFGPPARYLQLDRTKCCLPRNLGGHTCKYGFRHTEYGSSVTWDDALSMTTRSFEHKTYNLFTCNCHSYVAHCLNRLCYGGSMEWNMVNVFILLMLKGKWISPSSVVRSFLPCALVTSLGVAFVGWPFLIGLSSFSILLFAWFIIATYCFKNIIC